MLTGVNRGNKQGGAIEIVAPFLYPGCNILARPMTPIALMFVSIALVAGAVYYQWIYIRSLDKRINRLSGEVANLLLVRQRLGGNDAEN